MNSSTSPESDSSLFQSKGLTPENKTSELMGKPNQEKKRSEEMKKNLNLRLKPAEGAYSPFNSDLRVNKLDSDPNSYEVISKSEEIFKNPLKSAKDQNHPSKPLQSPFTMFCKGLVLSPAYQNAASPFNFSVSSFALRGGSDLIHIPSPSPLPLRPLHEMEASMEQKSRMTKLNFDNCLFLFNTNQDETSTETNDQNKLLDDLKSATFSSLKSPFFSNQTVSPNFNFMKKSIYTFPSTQPQNPQPKTVSKEPNTETIEHKSTAHQSPENLASLQAHHNNSESTKDLDLLAKSLGDNQSFLHETFLSNFSPSALNDLFLLQQSYSNKTTSQGLSSKETTEGSQGKADEEPVKTCCNCKKSRCLKLYCDCFARGEYCKGDCNCVQCLNTKETENERQAARTAILDKNPNAFKPKVDLTLNVNQINEKGKARHHTGCNCKKSGCQKKYCECYQAGVECSEACKCENCKNTSHSVCIKKAKKLGAFSFSTEGSAQKTKKSPVQVHGGRQSGNLEITNGMEVTEKGLGEDELIQFENPSKKLLMEKTMLNEKAKILHFLQENLQENLENAYQFSNEDKDGHNYMTRRNRHDKQSKRNGKVY